MGYDWERYGRRSLDVASAMTSIAFSAVKGGTKLGFSLARDVASNTVGVTAGAFDRVVFGGHTVTAPVIEGAVSTAITFAERLTLAPIFFGEYISSASLRAAHSSIDILSVIFPGSSEASFSLASFITLVKREWDSPGFTANMPDKRYGLTEVVRALVAWVALQGVTQEWQEKRWFNYLQEIQVYDHASGPQLKRVPSRVRVTSDVIFPGNRGQLIAADIGEAPRTRPRSSSTLSIGKLSISSMSSFKWKDVRTEPPQRPIAEVKANLRRFSKMVLAGYGGASLLFFGVSPLFTSKAAEAPTHSNEKDAEEAQLESAVNAAEAEAAGNQSSPVSLESDNPEYSWWDILMGKHDKEIFENSVHHDHDVEARVRATAVIGIERQMPRFWVLTDHGRRQVVLILRGTMSLNELAVDLTCEPAEFKPASYFSREESDDLCFGQHASGKKSRQTSYQSPVYHAHGGMLRMARVMGEIGKPVHLAVADALIRNPEYELILSGHSLGAGVATLLALMWADPTTCLTINSSGLPVDRPVSVYCVAPPCLVDAALSRLAAKLVVSFVYSDDIVSRLSLGSIRDMRNASLWLCDANERSGGTEGYAIVTQRARQWKAGNGSSDDPEWFLSVRKTLEVNMQMADLFPPGRILWAMRDGELHPSHRLSSAPKDQDKLRLFEVMDVEKVFSQVVFSRNMLGAHMPHRYDRILHELL
ncbi:alpha/beta-hydrolase [Leucogyrophana mollusca]|uniref:Alpha/beta-hydrolase n=1 Tax=Leucogyrophana mollusca TaxID=85980 RepID=A0ACB8BAA3_9AGAM|nr:alpha/beta-hydrolase [Leucogyrophana mollusca]